MMHPETVGIPANARKFVLEDFGTIGEIYIQERRLEKILQTVGEPAVAPTSLTDARKTHSSGLLKS
jgi:hypothetical protein